MSKRTPKAKSMKILDEATMTYRTVHLFNVTMSLKNDLQHVVQVYAPNHDEVLKTAERLYAGKGAFGAVVSAVEA